jgi:CheY-like chemotaxis protein
MGRILIVDDDPDFVEIVRAILTADGHDITTASNGEQALKRMRQQTPDLVLLDVMMSYVLDGLDVTQKMWEDPALRKIPVIMVSSLTATRESSLFPTDEHISIDDWISKPIDPKALRTRVSQLLRVR